MMSTLLVIMTFSSGMPALYVIGIFFFSLTYLINKMVLFKFYQKSLTLNRVMPLEGTSVLNLSIVIHMLFACFMLTNPSLFLTKDNPTDEAFTMPKLKIDPSKYIKDAVGIGKHNKTKDNLDMHLNNAVKMKYQTSENLGLTEFVVHTISLRIRYFHQQLYISFCLSLLFFFLAGKMMKDILLLTFAYIV